VQVDDVTFGRLDHRSATRVLAEFLHRLKDGTLDHCAEFFSTELHIWVK